MESNYVEYNVTRLMVGRCVFWSAFDQGGETVGPARVTPSGPWKVWPTRRVDPKDVLGLERADIHNGVGLYGNSLSDAQRSILEQAGIMEVVVAPDNDEPGAACVHRPRLFSSQQLCGVWLCSSCLERLRGEPPVYGLGPVARLFLTRGGKLLGR